MDYPPELKKEDSNEFSLIKKKLSDDKHYWNADTAKSFLNLIRNLEYTDFKDKDQILIKDLLKDYLFSLIENIDYPAGWNLNSNLSGNIEKCIDLNNSDKFIDSLEMLAIVEEFQRDFVRDEYKPKNYKEKRPIENLLDNLEEKTKDENANLLLSTYVNSIKQSPQSYVYSQGLTEDSLVYIGDKTYADISLSFFDSSQIRITDKKDFKFVKEVDSILKENNESLDFEEIIYSPEKKRLINKLKKLLNREINFSLFSETDNYNNDFLLDPKVFSILWTKKGFRESIERSIGIKLVDFNIKEQASIINFLKNLTNKESIRVKNFSDKYSIDGFRTFLSVEQGGREMGDKILTLGEKLQEDVAKKVFTKYGEIIDNVNKITEFTRTNFTKEIKTNPEFIKKIEETLYIKGKQLLLQIYDDLNNEKEVNYEQIDKQLDRINADTITTFAIFKQAVKNGEKLPIESIEGSVFSKKEASDIGDNQQNEMLELYELNWKNHPDRNFVESLKSYFKTAFSPEANKQKNYFYTFEKDNNIRAFIRFEKQNDASFYASALNVDEASKNFGLGEAMMDEALTREAKEHILHASCRKDNPSNMRYFEKGFISRGFKKTNETEEFDLVWDENKNKDILAKQKSQGELIDMQNTKEIEIRKSKDLKSLHENIPEGKSLVRCFLNNGEWYAVYEKISDDYGINLGETK